MHIPDYDIVHIIHIIYMGLSAAFPPNQQLFYEHLLNKAHLGPTHFPLQTLITTVCLLCVAVGASTLRVSQT